MRFLSPVTSETVVICDTHSQSDGRVVERLRWASVEVRYINLKLSLPLQEAQAEEQRMASRYANDIEIAKAQRDFELKKAAFDQEVQSKKAQSELAYELQVYTPNTHVIMYSCIHV